tara:strand:+ start:1101 stop:1280 length:180 start_codon:yes stop_codon:yes gene_type:complete
MEELDRQLLFSNLKEYMVRTSMVYSMQEAGEITKAEAFDKLYEIWEEYDEAAMRIFGEW